MAKLWVRLWPVFVALCATNSAHSSDLPLVAERHIRFTTHEVTWLSPDLSPDGRTLVFDVLGDLYSLPIEGGKARRLTSGLALDYTPQFIADGRTIRFRSDRGGKPEIWELKLNSDGAAQATPTKSAERLAIPNLNVAGLAADFEGALGHRVVREDGSEFRRVCEPVVGGNQRAARMNCTIERGAGDGITTTLVRQSGNINGLVVSRSGRWLIYSHQPEIHQTNLHVLDLQNGVDRIVLADSHPIVRTRAWPVCLLRYFQEGVPRSVFTLDEQAVISAQAGQLWRISLADDSRHAIPMTIDVDAELGPLVKWPHRVNDSEVTESQLMDLAPSPDGRRIAFRALGKIYVVDEQGGKPKRVTAEKWFDTPWFEAMPQWAPDGQSLAIVVDGDRPADVEERRSAVWRIWLDGRTPPQRLTTPTLHDVRYAWPGFLPSGEGLLLLRRDVPQPEKPAGVWPTWTEYYARDTAIIPLSAAGQARPAVPLLAQVPAGNLEVLKLKTLHEGASKSASTATLISMQLPLQAWGNGLIPVCAVAVRPDGTQVSPLTYLFTVHAARGFMFTDMAASAIANPLAITAQLARIINVQLSPDATHVLTQFSGDIAIGNVPASARARLLELARATGPLLDKSDAVDARCAMDLDRPIKEIEGQSATAMTDAVETLPIASGAFAVWMPDGKTIRYAVGKKIYSYDLGRAGLAGPRPTPPVRPYRPASVTVNVSRPIDKPSGSVALLHARVISMVGDTVIPDADIVISGSRIAAVGVHDSVVIPADATRIDIKGMTVLPGLANVHEHFRSGGGANGMQVGQGVELLRHLTYGSYFVA